MIEKKRKAPAIRHRDIEAIILAITTRCTQRPNGDDKPLPPMCLYVASVLLMGFANKETGRCFPETQSIADRLGVSVRSVKDAVKRLREDGFIETQRAWFNGPLSYHFTLPEWASQVQPTALPKVKQAALSQVKQAAPINKGNRTGEEEQGNWGGAVVPPLDSPAGHAAHGFDPSEGEESHTGANVVARTQA